jgi:hypothetical protein
MSKKNLLNETTVRRFMKLAEMESHVGNFVNENYYKDDEFTMQEQEAEEELGGEEMDVEMDVPEEGGEEDLGVELEDEEAEVDVEEPAGEPGELTLTDEEADVLLKVADKVRAAMEVAPEGEELEAPDMEPEAEMEMDAEMDVPEEGGEEVPEEEEELQEIDVVDDDTLVQEIARRVAKRLLTKKNK